MSAAGRPAASNSDQHHMGTSHGGDDAFGTIATLQREHRPLAVLLDLIEAEVTVFERGAQPDYELVQAILRYLLTYPDLVHHPKEDAVLRRLKAAAPEAAEAVGDLKAEHARLAIMNRHFNAAVSNVLADATLPRAWFAELARDFVAFGRRHMQMEEVVFFPAAQRHLGPDDWRQIEREQPAARDPLAPCADRLDDAELLKTRLLEEMAGK